MTTHNPVLTQVQDFTQTQAHSQQTLDELRTNRVQLWGEFVKSVVTSDVTIYISCHEKGTLVMSRDGVLFISADEHLARSELLSVGEASDRVHVFEEPISYILMCCNDETRVDVRIEQREYFTRFVTAARREGRIASG